MYQNLSPSSHRSAFWFTVDSEVFLGRHSVEVIVTGAEALIFWSRPVDAPENIDDCMTGSATVGTRQNYWLIRFTKVGRNLFFF